MEPSLHNKALEWFNYPLYIIKIDFIHDIDFTSKNWVSPARTKSQ